MTSLDSSSPRTVRAVAVQPHWTVADFRSERAFRAWLGAQLDAARPHLSDDHPNLVVLTELNGLPLLLRGAFVAQRAPTFTAALALLVVRSLPEVLLGMIRERVSAPRALQLALADRVAAPYLGVCRDLARRHGVYLACGTAPLPHFRRVGDRLVPDTGDVYNHAVVLGPDGRLVGTADKVHLTTPEGPSGLDLSAGDLRELRVYPTPAGDLAVATSLDAFRDDVVGHVSDLGATVLLQPDANGSPWTDQEHEPPTGRDQPVAWLDSAWRAVRTSPTLRYVVNPMVVGNLFDVAFDGQSAITARDDEAPEPRGYVMTSPRPGFLALLPWVTDSSDPEELREVGRQLAPRSGHPRENRYVTGVVGADLHLPPATTSMPAPRPHEQALQDALDDPAVLRPSPARRVLRAAWPAACAALAVWGLRSPRRHPGRLPLGLLGLVLTALTAPSRDA